MNNIFFYVNFLLILCTAQMFSWFSHRKVLIRLKKLSDSDIYKQINFYGTRVNFRYERTFCAIGRSNLIRRALINIMCNNYINFILNSISS